MTESGFEFMQFDYRICAFDQNTMPFKQDEG